VDATTGDHIWAEHYDRPLRNIFSLQDEIVRKIVTTLNLQLNLAENRVWVVQRTHNLEAYDYYLRGLEFFRNPVFIEYEVFSSDFTDELGQHRQIDILGSSW
jgi:hypothetical protein